jgi:chemotaxis protein MotB
VRPGHEGGPRGGHDRWLLSYADLVTLLLAVFTTLYAASSVDARKMAGLESSLREAFKTPPVQPVVARNAIVGPVVVVPGQGAEEDLRQRLMKELAGALRQERVDIEIDARGLVVSLPEEATFAVAKTELSADARALIERIAAVVASTSGTIRIEGHTDDVPIRTERFASNWELSTARASAVVAYLVEENRFDPTRLSAAGYGEFHPRAANDTPENRARNRRIDIVILESVR